MSQEDYDALVHPPETNIEEHIEKVRCIYWGSFQAVLKVWNKLPQAQWENTRATSRDLIEWKDLVAVLIPFRKELKSLRKIRKAHVNVETQSS